MTLLGCDYKIAFGLACRPCANQLLGTEFLNPKIEFQVNTAAGSSQTAVSITGTGAGRATGGPGFNIIFNHQISTHPDLKHRNSTNAPFADDSMVKSAINANLIETIIEAFKDGKKYGLYMHETGKKGPTMLVKPSQVSEVSSLMLDGGIVDINVVDEVKFLGVNIKICSKNNIMTANMTSSAIKKMNFFVSELNKTYRLVNYSPSPNAPTSAFLAASFAIASTIESRIQYSLMFLNTKSLFVALNIHRRTICTLTGKSFRFFGFKNLESTNEDFVEDLFGLLSEKCSMTYTVLCKALGRPTIVQMALRSAMVILEQINESELVEDYNSARVGLRKRLPPFLKKVKKFVEDCEANGITNISPRENEAYTKFFSIKNFQKKRTFLKVLTDTQLLNQIKSKGWTPEDDKCRIGGCDSESKETIDHLLDQHLDLALQKPGVRRELKRLRNVEKNTKSGERIVMHPNAEAAGIIAEVFDGVQEPALKIVKRNNRREQN